MLFLMFPSLGLCLRRTLNELDGYVHGRELRMTDKPLDKGGNALKLRPWTHLELSGFQPMGSHVKATQRFFFLFFLTVVL